jgi:hypothetical protein
LNLYIFYSNKCNIGIASKLKSVFSTSLSKRLQQNLICASHLLSAWYCPGFHFILLAAGWGSGGAAAGTNTDLGSPQLHATAQDQLTHQRLPDGLKLRKI